MVDFLASDEEMGLARERGFMESFNMPEIRKKSAKKKAKCLKKNKTWSEEKLTALAYVLSSNEERDKS